MSNSQPIPCQDIFPITWTLLPEPVKSEILENQLAPKDIPARIEDLQDALPGYLVDLAGLELAVHETARQVLTEKATASLDINPHLQIFCPSWKNLPELVKAGSLEAAAQPEPGQDRVLVWPQTRTPKVRVRSARPRDLLALKIAAEGLSPAETARDYGYPVFQILAFLQEAKAEGLLEGPISSIRRKPEYVEVQEPWARDYQEAGIFTLQWHVTQACDLHCRHCYDRSSRSYLDLDKALRILEGFTDFCARRRVRGQVSFSGGNPLLYPEFQTLYRAAAQGGLITAVLGNPAEREMLERLAAIQRPAFYQISLEGLRAHNDWIRQPGHFQRSLDFLSLLREMNIPSRVMLTLTEANLDQVLPLAEMLRDKVDRFTFNRLSLVGEGAFLRLPAPENYQKFLGDFLDAAKSNPVIGLKDNLFNVVLHEHGQPLFGGCTGFGCGAAFNFVSLLPDGEVHACRKFPSYLGNVFEHTFDDIYDGPQARAYRAGPAACRDCSISPVCRGCLAVVHSLGLDVSTDRDPFCPLPTDRSR
ncbi:MAG: thio(seleno)oxazole modification radical SAM maturase SbtM [Thermodesulfobacteriota bacterium]